MNREKIKVLLILVKGVLLLADVKFNSKLNATLSPLDKMYYNELREYYDLRYGKTKPYTPITVPLPPEVAEQRAEKKSDSAAGNRVNISRLRRVRLLGIKEEYYVALNNADVFYWADYRKLSRRKAASTKETMYDNQGRVYSKDGFQVDVKTGEIVREEVTVPKGSVVVITTVNIHVPYSYKPKEQGFMYVDFEMIGGKPYRIYVIPAHYCFPLNEMCLTITRGFRGNSVDSYVVSFVNGTTLVLSVIPLESALRDKKDDSVIIARHTDLNFGQMIRHLTEYWIKQGVMFPAEYGTVSKTGFDGGGDGEQINNVFVRRVKSEGEDFASAYTVLNRCSLADKKNGVDG